MTATPAPEFSRPIDVADLPVDGRRETIAADAGERARLAERFGLVAVEELAAEVEVIPAAGRVVLLRAGVRARIAQLCAVTAERFENDLEFDCERRFSAAAVDDAMETEIDSEAEDPPDPIVDGAIDAGETVAEELALRIDPFARKPGAVFWPPTGESAAHSDAANGGDGPFSALAALRDDDGG